jgi:histone H3/H4
MSSRIAPARSSLRERERERESKQDARVGITPSSVRRIARRAGVAKINMDVYEPVMQLYDAFVGTLVHEMCVHARHARHPEIALEDARAALRERGITIYA